MNKTYRHGKQEKMTMPTLAKRLTVVNHIKILPCRSLQVSFDHIHIPSIPNTAFKTFFSLLIQ